MIHGKYHDTQLFILSISWEIFQAFCAATMRKFIIPHRLANLTSVRAAPPMQELWRGRAGGSRFRLCSRRWGTLPAFERRQLGEILWRSSSERGDASE